VHVTINGQITAVSHKHRDIIYKFMHLHNPSSRFKWPAVKKTCAVPLRNILLKVHPHSQACGMPS